MTEDKLRDGNDLAARLLRAGSSEQPRNSARSRAERAIGLSGVAAGAFLSAKASATVATATVGSSARLAVPMFAKWLTLGMLAGGAVLGGATAIRSAFEVTPSPVQPPRVTAVASLPELVGAHPAQVPFAPAVSASATAPAVGHAESGASTSKIEPLRPSLPSSGRLTSQAPAAAVESPLANGDALLSHEVELLERVRTKLRAGNSGEALAELAAIRGDIQSLMTEADLLRVEALLAHGERARAEALANDLRRRGEGQNFRLKRLLGDP